MTHKKVKYFDWWTDRFPWFWHKFVSSSCVPDIRNGKNEEVSTKHEQVVTKEVGFSSTFGYETVFLLMQISECVRVLIFQHVFTWHSSERVIIFSKTHVFLNFTFVSFVIRIIFTSPPVEVNLKQLKFRYHYKILIALYTNTINILYWINLS